MDLVTSLFTYCAALGIAAAIPGPGVAGLVGQSLGAGFKASLFFLAGIALGDVVYLTIAVAGLAALVKVFSGTLLLLKLAGGAYLLYLAYKFWTSKAGLTRMDQIPTQSKTKTFFAGFSVTLGNPKTIIFYMSLLPTVVDLTQVGPGQWLVLSMATIAVLFATLTPYALLAARARGLMAQLTSLRRLNRIAACIIGATGTAIVGQATTALAQRN